MSKNFEVIYKESNLSEEDFVMHHEEGADDLSEDESSFSEEGSDLTDSGDGVTYFELEMPDEEHTPEDVVTVREVLEPLVEGDDSLGELGEELMDLDDEFSDIMEEHGDESAHKLLIPGSSTPFEDSADDEPKKKTTYKDDGDISDFMNYIREMYPAKIPQHDGSSTVGCERAITFLDKLNSEISRAIREDSESVLDINQLEEVRVKIMKDVLVLKDHLNNLKKKIKDNAKSASVVVDSTGFVKEATTPRNVVIAVSPFERAIVGIMINAHVSAGHSLDKVFDFLCDKYDLTEREQLAVMQVCMDSGFHIFKDRGTLNSKPGEKGDDDGVDFVRNYFA
jgi:hypothetical protein